MYDKIKVNDSEICSFQSVPVIIRECDSKERNNVSVKRVLAGDEVILDAAIASGRPGVFNYIELSNIRETVMVNGKVVDYFGSQVENAVLGFFAGLLGRADLIHVEYFKDSRTWNELKRGVPPVLSRQGFKLFELGFTWFKDWYIAEGWLEGPIKLTAEKPIDEVMVKRNMLSIISEVEKFRKSDTVGEHSFRIEEVLKLTESYLTDPALLLTP